MSLRTPARMLAAALVATATLLPAAASAQSVEAGSGGEWHFNAILYGYFPTFGGDIKVPTGAGASIDVGPNSYLSDLKMTFMGTLDVHNGRWGVFNDVLYLNVGGSQLGTREFSLGERDIPGSVTLDGNLDLKGTVWTVAGEYRLASDKAWTVDALLGARYLTLRPSLDWQLNGDIGGLPVPGRSGNTSVRENNWDAVVGVKGNYAFGDRGEWKIPFYADIGTGQSDLTYQVAGGLGYSFSWGDVLAMWRYLGWNMKSGDPVQKLTMNGPMIGVRFGW